MMRFLDSSQASRPSAAVQTQCQNHTKKLAPKPQTFCLWVAGTAAAAALLTSPVEAANLEVGRQVFENNCAACHTGGFNAVSAEKTLRKADIEKYLDGGFTLEAIEYQVENGKGPMPAWGDRLTEDEIKSVAAYVFDQANGNKW